MSAEGTAAPLRVLIISSMYPKPDQPVNGIFVHEQVKALIERGADARVVTGDPVRLSIRRPISSSAKLLDAIRRHWTGWALHDGVPVARMPYPVGLPIPPVVRPWLYAAALDRWLPQLSGEFPFTLVHVHTGFLDGRAGLIASRRRGVPMVLTEHTGPLSVVTRNPLRRIHVQAAVEGANRILAVSRSLRDDMLNQLRIDQRDVLEVLPNGVDVGFFNRTQRNTCKISPGERRGIRALWVGHLVPVKRLDRLLDALAVSRVKHPELLLEIVGSGPLEQGLRKRARDRGLDSAVRFSPLTDRVGVRAAMNRSDFLVISSETETFGVVAIEAMAMGLPVLSTACGGPQDIIDDNSLGMLVPNNTEGLSSGLSVMCEALPRFQADTIREAAMARFDWPLIAGRLMNLYTMLLAERGVVAATSGHT